MHKWKWVVFLTILALAGLIVGLSRLARSQHRQDTTTIVDAGASASTEEPISGDAGLLAQDVTEVREAPNAAQADAHSQVLPPNAPNDVVFGAVLVTFEGVQGAPSKPRTKAAALEIAKRLLPVAQENFESAVKQGDPGSTANAGTIRRGILEPPVEFALFTLEKGTVYPEPIETPRGYWLMKRIR
jgi:hypothetical protein